MEVKEWVALKIKDRLYQYNMQKKDLAFIMGSQPSEVSKWVSGNHNFTLETLVKIEKALNIKFFANEPEQDAQQRCFPCITEKLF